MADISQSTNYVPLDNGFQIREALEMSCDLVNLKSNVFEKSLLVLLLLSHIQAFSDDNKRTARIIMLLFYEQNNVSAFKHIFINQFEFAVNTYF